MDLKHGFLDSMQKLGLDVTLGKKNVEKERSNLKSR